MQWVLCNSRYYDQDCQHTDSRLKALAVNSSQPSGWLWLYAGLIGTGSKRHKGDELPGNGPCLYESFFLLMDVSGWMFLLVPAHPDSSRQRAIKQLYVYVSLYDILFSMCTQNGTCVTVAVNSVHCCWIMRRACVASCRTLQCRCLPTGCHSSVDVIVADKHVSSGTLQLATQLNIAVVSCEWVIQCLIAGRRLSFTGHDKYAHKPTWLFSLQQMLQWSSSVNWIVTMFFTVSLARACLIALHLRVI